MTLTDLEGKIISASERTAEIHGFESAEELIGMSWYALLPPEELARAIETIGNRIWEEGQLTGMEYTMLKKNGSTFFGDMNVARILDSDGNPKAYLGIVRDVTRRKRGEEKLNGLNAELDAFARTVSHDIKGPLASIAMSIELLEGLVAEPSSKATRSDMSEIIGTTRKSLSRALALIDDLLSNAEAGEKPALTTSVDVAGVVQTLLEEQAPLIESCQARMLVDPDMGGIVADPVHIYQLFSNLITNALRYCDSTHPDIEIRFLGDDDTGAHRYLVRDNGAGIPADAMGRIFEPFFKGPDGESGIGLAIVDKIVRMYDGDIKAYNDGGACFEFLLRDYQS